MSGVVRGVVPGERQVRLLALRSFSFQTSDLEHLSRRCFDLFVRVFEYGSSSLQTSDLLCRCLRLSYLQSRHLISASPWSFCNFSDRTCLCNAFVSSFVIGPPVHVYGGARSLWRHPKCRHLSCFSFFRRSGKFAVPGTNSLSSAPPFLRVCLIARKTIVVADI